MNRNNWLKARKHFNIEGTGLVLHHIDVNMRVNDPERYDLWLPEDLVVMTAEEHNKYHGNHHSDTYKENLAKGK